MKLKYILCSLMLAFHLGISPLSAKVKGDFLVTLKHDTISIVVETNPFDGNLLCSINGVDKKYEPNQILYYRDGTDNYESAFVNVTPHGKKHWSFLLREETVKPERLIILSKMILVPNDSAGTSLTNMHYCRHPGETNGKIKSLNTNEDMIDVFSDCPQLIVLLKAKPPISYNDALTYYLDKSKCK